VRSWVCAVSVTYFHHDNCWRVDSYIMALCRLVCSDWDCQTDDNTCCKLSTSTVAILVIALNSLKNLLELDLNVFIKIWCNPLNIQSRSLLFTCNSVQRLLCYLYMNVCFFVRRTCISCFVLFVSVLRKCVKEFSCAVHGMEVCFGWVTTFANILHPYHLLSALGSHHKCCNILYVLLCKVERFAI